MLPSVLCQSLLGNRKRPGCKKLILQVSKKVVGLLWQCFYRPNTLIKALEATSTQNRTHVTYDSVHIILSVACRVQMDTTVYIN